MMLQAKYQGSRPCGSRQKIIFSLYKQTCDSQGGAIVGSRPCGSRQDDFLKFPSRKSIFSQCDLGMQQTGTI